MSEEDVELYALKKIREEKEEELRVKRLMESDKKSEEMYDELKSENVRILKSAYDLLNPRLCIVR